MFGGRASSPRPNRTVTRPRRAGCSSPDVCSTRVANPWRAQPSWPTRAAKYGGGAWRYSARHQSANHVRIIRDASVWTRFVPGRRSTRMSVDRNCARLRCGLGRARPGRRKSRGAHLAAAGAVDPGTATRCPGASGAGRRAHGQRDESRSQIGSRTATGRVGKRALGVTPRQDVDLLAAARDHRR